MIAAGSMIGCTVTAHRYERGEIRGLICCQKCSDNGYNFHIIIGRVGLMHQFRVMISDIMPENKMFDLVKDWLDTMKLTDSSLDDEDANPLPTTDDENANPFEIVKSTFEEANEEGILEIIIDSALEIGNSSYEDDFKSSVIFLSARYAFAGTKSLSYKQKETIRMVFNGVSSDDFDDFCAQIYGPCDVDWSIFSDIVEADHKISATILNLILGFIYIDGKLNAEKEEFLSNTFGLALTTDDEDANPLPTTDNEDTTPFGIVKSSFEKASAEGVLKIIINSALEIGNSPYDDDFKSSLIILSAEYAFAGIRNLSYNQKETIRTVFNGVSSDDFDSFCAQLCKQGYRDWSIFSDIVEADYKISVSILKLILGFIYVDGKPNAEQEEFLRNTFELALATDALFDIFNSDEEASE